eukprot:TRINITY_DN9645_c0_g1_i3.p1 TRINITY_DN9645_c0_g1~~TRINITY_DN9645_c0_g1_i3.p1  ORF type:complete len:339 (+),score=68.30 TRINITY_DN9645_c0_g1_i3:47-1063(+)
MTVLGLDTPVKKGVFLTYLGLWCVLRLVVYASQHDPLASGYDTAALLVVVTVLKLVISIAWFCVDNGSGGLRGLAQQVSTTRLLFLRYFFPAASYVVYDNMMFFCLARLDPVTYVILMQFRLPVTGFVWQTVFGRNTTRTQWFGLAFIMIACIVQRTTVHKSQTQITDEDLARGNASSLMLGIMGVVVQIACGVFSSIYNEKMLKKGDISLHLQNIYMYTHSLICNLVYIVCLNGLSALSPGSFAKLLNKWVVPTCLLLSCIGIATSLFLKHLDSVKKSIASALELFGDAALSWYFFAIPVTLPTLGSVFLCASGIVLYSQEPLVTHSPVSNKHTSMV